MVGFPLRGESREEHVANVQRLAQAYWERLIVNGAPLTRETADRALKRANRAHDAMYN